MHTGVGLVPVLVVERLGLDVLVSFFTVDLGDSALTRFMYSHILSPDHSFMPQSS